MVAPRGAGAADESGGARMDFRNGAGAGREGKEGTLDLWVRLLGDGVGGFATACDISVLLAASGNTGRDDGRGSVMSSRGWTDCEERDDGRGSVALWAEYVDVSSDKDAA